MKRALFAFALLLGGLGNASAATVTLLPSAGTVQVSQLFSIDLAITGNSGEILGFGLDYSVGSPAISLQSVVINSFFGADLNLGTPMVSAITFPGSTDPNVTLVTFNFLAAQMGSSLFSVSTDLNDPNQGVIFLSDPTLDATSSVTINVVPEPATFGLGALAAGLIWAARRRQRGL